MSHMTASYLSLCFITTPLSFTNHPPLTVVSTSSCQSGSSHVRISGTRTIKCISTHYVYLRASHRAGASVLHSTIHHVLTLWTIFSATARLLFPFLHQLAYALSLLPFYDSKCCPAPFPFMRLTHIPMVVVIILRTSCAEPALAPHPPALHHHRLAPVPVHMPGSSASARAARALSGLTKYASSTTGTHNQLRAPVSNLTCRKGYRGGASAFGKAEGHQARLETVVVHAIVRPP